MPNSAAPACDALSSPRTRQVARLSTTPRIASLRVALVDGHTPSNRCELTFPARSIGAAWSQRGRSSSSVIARQRRSDAYNSVVKALPAERKQALRKLAVATRGTMMYDTILVGESGFDEEYAANRATPMQHEGMLAHGLKPFFAGSR